MTYPCRLWRCEDRAVQSGIMCRKHWRIVPMPLQTQIRRAIAAATQVDPRSNPNGTNAWKILCAKATVAVLKAQGKTDAMNDELDRLALLEPKSVSARGAIAHAQSPRSGRGSGSRPHGAS